MSSISLRCLGTFKCANTEAAEYPWKSQIDSDFIFLSKYDGAFEFVSVFEMIGPRFLRTSIFVNVFLLLICQS